MNGLRGAHKFLLVGAAALLALGAGCSSGSIDPATQSEPAEHLEFDSVPSAVEMVASTRALGLSVLADHANDTIVTSPASTVIALSMLGSGATGEAEAQFTEVLGVGGQDRDRAANALIGSLEPFATDLDKVDLDALPEEPRVHLANQLVLNDGFTPKAKYSESLMKWFGAHVATVDLASASGKKYLDQWVRENTAGLIEESAVELSPQLRFVLQNAVLFVSKWQCPFDAANSVPADFTLSTGEEITTEFMTAQLPIRYAELDGWLMVELPYGTEGQLVALYVLPPDGVEPTSLTPEMVSGLEDHLNVEDVVVKIPKVDLKSSFDLVPSLADMGLTSLFSASPPALQYISEGGAEGEEELVVSLINQQARIQIDEDGTAAAAVTEIAVESTAALEDEPPVPKYFTADRPHLVLITDAYTGWDLFQVLVNDPRSN